VIEVSLLAMWADVPLQATERMQQHATTRPTTFHFMSPIMPKRPVNKEMARNEMPIFWCKKERRKSAALV
jgi:hypothetical protein